jgi:unsaturated rhamnogalacturonyl hydrolase
MGSITLRAEQLPAPTPQQQAGIDKDNARHFGSSPSDGGPLATDLSPAIKPAAIDAAIRKVANWQLAVAQPYFDRIWTWSVLYSGFMAASDATGDPKYRDAMEATGRSIAGNFATASRTQTTRA